MIGLALTMGRIMSPRNRLMALATQGFYRLLSLCPPARDYIMEMKYRPAPRFPSGFLVPSPAAGRDNWVGRLLSQPLVRIEEGRATLLDEVIGNRFAVIAYGADPAAIFARLDPAVWGKLDVVRLGIVPTGVPLAPATGLRIVGDTDGAFGRIFARLRDHILVLRPDHYVAAQLSPSNLAQDLRAVEDLLRGTWSDAGRLPRRRHIAA
jgi:3-(3-hydroxy-phenyl)propionate hydroxylase